MHRCWPISPPEGENRAYTAYHEQVSVVRPKLDEQSLWHGRRRCWPNLNSSLMQFYRSLQQSTPENKGMSACGCGSLLRILSASEVKRPALTGDLGVSRKKAVSLHQIPLG
jgi:hypothetical protein